MDWLVDELDKNEERLTFAIWLQHNEKPRSVQFSNAIEAIGKMPHNTTVLVAGSRHADQAKRFEHFAVSGAFVKSALFPSQFDKFTHRFHYVEPSATDVSRAVLLRYDADAYRVRTVLADAIDSADGVEKGELFDESQPYLFVDGALTPSTEHVHLHDLCAPATQSVETASPGLAASLTPVVSALSALGTQKFLEFLDVGIVPRPAPGQREHLAGTKHEGGDARCRCWSHRECIDFLTENEAKPHLAALIHVLAILESQECSPRLKYDKRSRTNLELSLNGQQCAVVIVHPMGSDLEVLQRKLFGDKAPLRAKHIIVVIDGGHRPKVRTVKAGEAPAVNAIDASKADMPRLEPVHVNQVLDAAERGDLVSFLSEQFV
jgi:hypothetical protein